MMDEELAARLYASCQPHLACLGTISLPESNPPRTAVPVVCSDTLQGAVCGRSDPCPKVLAGAVN